MPQITVSFEMKDGRELRCEYWYHTTPGFTSGLPGNCYPDETDVGDPEYFIDKELIDLDSLPKGLDVIADAMYESGFDNDSRFRYKYKETDDY